MSKNGSAQGSWDAEFLVLRGDEDLLHGVEFHLQEAIRRSSRLAGAHLASTSTSSSSKKLPVAGAVGGT